MFLATFDNLEHASFELPLEKAAFAPASPIVCGVLFPRVRVSKTLILIVRAPKIKVSRRQQKVGENIVMERLEEDEGYESLGVSPSWWLAMCMRASRLGKIKSIAVQKI